MSSLSVSCSRPELKPIEGLGTGYTRFWKSILLADVCWHQFEIREIS